MGGGGRKRGKEVNFEFLPSPRPFPLNEKAFEALDTKPYFLDVVILVNYENIKRDLLSIHLSKKIQNIRKTRKFSTFYFRR